MMCGERPQLTEFLLARIAEDEAAARASAPDASWRKTWPQYAEDHAFDIDLVLRFDPARVLADCEAKRLRLTLAADIEGEADDDTYGSAHSIAERIRKIEALPYADHPDYREEWKPTA